MEIVGNVEMYKKVTVNFVGRWRNASCGQCSRLERERQRESLKSDNFLFLDFLHDPFITRSISALLLVSQNVKYRKKYNSNCFPPIRMASIYTLYAVSLIGRLVAPAHVLGNPVLI